MTRATSVPQPPASTVPAFQRIRFTRAEVVRLLGLFGFIAALHVAGFGLFFYYNSQPQFHSLSDGKGNLVFAGAAALAYGFGLRHAFDADHISAIDDTTRYLLQKGKQPLGVGFFFSLGHSTIVLALSIGVAFAAKAASRFQASFAGTGGIIGTLVSASFLYLLAGLNLVVLIGIVKMWRQAKLGRYQPEELDVLLANRGLMNRIFRGRYNKFINHSWQMYPVGVLFGLGFDTATEVAVLGLSATAAVGVGAGGASLPPLAILSLPLLFAAGMSLMDTIDGVFMSKAYSWAFVTPIRKIYYNITTTGLSIFVAFVIGSIQVVGLLSEKLELTGQPWDLVNGINLNTAGQLIVVVFLLVWVGAVAYYKLARVDERYAGLTRESGPLDSAG
ncbi:MAG TPA: HoxN/HupN/NixA family nickel/cobalt transporter [Jatrophihabitans sp.]|jgi:high-affinity nickel-transport protein|uniref:HoxN/HupN/NixA family nickel/cobalt transporter n=1 Tax=Jatrophihabitans sp. TaxID=1932789 RepID=UPI002EFB8085